MQKVIHMDWTVFCKKIGYIGMKKKKLIQFIQTYYPIILAFVCDNIFCFIRITYFGYTEEAQYSVNWPATIRYFSQ